jgi:hypothetical protein
VPFRIATSNRCLALEPHDDFGHDRSMRFDELLRRLRPAIGLVAASLVVATLRAQTPPASDLLVRVGLTTDEASQARAGQPVVRMIQPNTPAEVAAAGAIRIRGDLERLVTWLRDIEDFRKAAGTENVGVISRPPNTADFSRGAPAGLTADIQQRLAACAAAYQSGGDDALGACHESQPSRTFQAEFQDMLRRATTLWNLAYPFAVYLEAFPKQRMPEVEDFFYWTVESDGRQPMTALHHVVLQRLADKSLRLADKQFYASRDLDAALLVGQATPVSGAGSFDLVVSVRARSGRLAGVAARVLRSRIEREVADSLAMYLDWLRRNYALG